MKYPLLIHEIKKGLPKDHPDVPALDVAMKAGMRLCQ
jgi:hypothetical protein